MQALQSATKNVELSRFVGELKNSIPRFESKSDLEKGTKTPSTS
jgi:hypothetical protein